MAAMLRDSVVVVVVRTRPRAIPLAMITIRKSFMGFLFFPVMTMGLRLAALRAAGAPLLGCRPARFNICISPSKATLSFLSAVSMYSQKRKVNLSNDFRIGHFWIILYLDIKTSSCAKPFIQKCVPPTCLFSCKSNSFSFEILARGLVLK